MVMTAFSGERLHSTPPAGLCSRGDIDAVGRRINTKAHYIAPTAAVNRANQVQYSIHGGFEARWLQTESEASRHRPIPSGAPSYMLQILVSQPGSWALRESTHCCRAMRIQSCRHFSIASGRGSCRREEHEPEGNKSCYKLVRCRGLQTRLACGEAITCACDGAMQQE